MHNTNFHEWTPDEDDLRDLDARKARDLIIDCFFASQQETFERTKQSLGVAADHDAIRRSVVSVVRLSFDQVGGDFEDPTKDALQQVIVALAAHASAWGTPQDIIDRHRREIEEILGRCRD